MPPSNPTKHPVQPIIRFEGNSSGLFHIAPINLDQESPREEDENPGIFPEGDPVHSNAGQVESLPFMSPIGPVKI